MTAPVSKKSCPCSLAALWVPRLVVGGLFVYTGITKLQALGNFAKEIRQYELVPENWTNVMAYVLPWMEILAAVVLIIGLLRREGRLLLVGMLVVFTAAKTIMLAQGKKLEDCGCVPTGSALHFLFDGWVGVGTNVVLLILLGIEVFAACARRKACCRAVAAEGDAPPQTGGPAPAP
jgi:putative oxidoreductase